jgi:hypothetical protein
MSTLFDFLRTAARIFVGSVLLLIGVASALTIQLPPNASPAELQGRIVGSLLFALIFGVVGFKMLTRRNLPRESS